MDFTTFAAGVKSRKKAAAVYLFYGEEGLLRRRGAELVRGIEKKFGENIIRLTSSETSWSALLSELCTAPFLGGKKLVVVHDEGNFFHNEASHLKTYVVAPSHTAVLVALSGATKCPVNFESKDLVAVSCCSLKPFEVQKWIQTELQQRGKTIDRATSELFVSRAGTDLSALNGYLDTLSLYAAGRSRISSEDVRSLVGDDSEYKVFELALTTASKDLVRSLVVLHGLLEAGENAHSLLWRLAWQYRKMTEARRLIESGVRRFEVTSRLQITYYADKFLATVDRHTSPELLDKHQAILDADIGLKTSGSGAEEAILDSLICKLASESAEVMHG